MMPLFKAWGNLTVTDEAVVRSGFIDVVASGKPSQFWVRVEDNPGVPPESAPVEASLDANGEILFASAHSSDAKAYL